MLFALETSALKPPLAPFCSAAHEQGRPCLFAGARSEGHTGEAWRAQRAVCRGEGRSSQVGASTNPSAPPPAGDSRRVKGAAETRAGAAPAATAQHTRQHAHTTTTTTSATPGLAGRRCGACQQ